ncbi:class II aldolase/adducin family protein [Paenibacillus alvei]|uniref:Class II aldolase/adducin family protein n=1 Tax=Paenibacillus alvei TaxID=44250 RepID=A0ABT4GTE0_PAEAL|nr:class II aldolase/adducin family protein [Paenibacillus alvei]MCY7483328.1 class II aldolase/adducin family protein [Paenibacillus alvei]MCY9759962.1 class II aldolase/adducin family protein [Paenibacillus alvei]MCY9768172.1 class II aldolase/adducin family protein [Paenibacillus alvei]
MTQLNSDMDVKAFICEIGRRMYARSYVAANDGNISIKSDENTIWTTPTGVSKGYMTPDMLVQMDMKGNVLAGTYKPSSEVRMHLRVYAENPEVRAVVHAHPPAATAFAIAGIDLDQAISPEAIVNLGKVAVAPYATPGTQEVPDSIAPYCKDYHAVLLANHGALTWGRDMTEAYFRMESLEHYALMYMYASRLIGHANELSRDQVSELVSIRNRMGVKGGGFPSFREEREDTELFDQLVEKVAARVAAQLQLES